MLAYGSAAIAMGMLGMGRASATEAEVIFETSYGKVRGTRVDGINIFKGVRYGASAEGAACFLPIGTHMPPVPATGGGQQVIAVHPCDPKALALRAKLPAMIGGTRDEASAPRERMANSTRRRRSGASFH